MCEVLDKFEFRGRGEAGSHALEKYPWGEWMDGKIRRLTKGKDFDLTVENMMAQVRQTARKRDMRIRANREGNDSFVFQAYSDS